MDLPGNVKPQLWSAISQPYEAADYSHAILKAMHYMSETLRERTGSMVMVSSWSTPHWVGILPA